MSDDNEGGIQWGKVLLGAGVAAGAVLAATFILPEVIEWTTKNSGLVADPAQMTTREAISKQAAAADAADKVLDNVKDVKTALETSASGLPPAAQEQIKKVGEQILTPEVQETLKKTAEAGAPARKALSVFFERNRWSLTAGGAAAGGLYKLAKSRSGGDDDAEDRASTRREAEDIGHAEQVMLQRGYQGALAQMQAARFAPAMAYAQQRGV